jgi:hypothetical protein
MATTTFKGYHGDMEQEYIGQKWPEIEMNNNRGGGG